MRKATAIQEHECYFCHKTIYPNEVYFYSHFHHKNRPLCSQQCAQDWKYFEKLYWERYGGFLNETRKIKLDEETMPVV